jgi:hypothetical protein
VWGCLTLFLFLPSSPLSLQAVSHFPLLSLLKSPASGSAALLTSI